MCDRRLHAPSRNTCYLVTLHTHGRLACGKLYKMARWGPAMLGPLTTTGRVGRRLRTRARSLSGLRPLPRHRTLRAAIGLQAASSRAVPPC
jgi:hypothetical protein